MRWFRWIVLTGSLVFLVACTTTSQTPLPTVTPVPPPPTSSSSPGSLQSLPSIADIVERVMPAVVAVNTEAVQVDFFFQMVVPGAGTGAIVRPDGYIVTNNHVIEDAREITVVLADGRTFPATVIGRDPEGDLAVIKIEAEGLPTVSFGNSRSLRIGDWVIALGNAEGLEGSSTVTLGIVSALGRTIQTDAATQAFLFDTIQTDAAINPGNSGGPLVNLEGEMVGINTAIQGNAQGIGFAIPAAVVEPTVASLIERGRVIRAYLGVENVALSPSVARQLGIEQTEGIFLRRVLAGTPAGRAGLQPGDVMLKLGGELVRSDAEFRRALWRYRPGDTIVVEFLRNGRTSTVSVTLDERPPSAALFQSSAFA
ncbi:MAG: PDZ domain-containing protein [SAR202 cluster bacterium]|nr:PDZ domain-containing protein [SAR202 cluster bacterium]